MPTKKIDRLLPFALFTSLLLALASAWFWPATVQSKPQAEPRAVQPRGALEPAEQTHIRVFKKVSPSVVHITTLARSRDFFSMNITEQPQGTGSGFIWDDSGHVVTNFHVIQGANAATVTLSDQSTYPAKLVGVFPDRDLAVLRIDAPKDKLTAIAIGSSGDLQVGQAVYAIGNPFGLDQTLTTGIVSALNREIESVTRRSIRGAIQTDAAINPGNSGGPLLDSAGRLIGVNTSIYSPSGASAGIGFAIPVDEVNRVVPRLIRDGRIIRPSLGVTAAAANVNQALKLPPGVALVRIAPGSPAAQAGLQVFGRGRDGRLIQGDVITAVNGEPVADLDDMLNRLEQRQVGERVTLSLWNSGQTRKQQLTLGSSD
ncbi:S1C family serine protease [Paucibacter sp. KBW04]|uniref:S1C family serine protease n=1 Tax=Paucibacter sp. KBW04 TaxID=2153361 RepID=UPI0018CC60FE|nr:trypsin-like peptidase domain-containing protein [Paucibacter sp. KBW04]